MKRILLPFTFILYLHFASAQDAKVNYLYRCNETLVQIIMEDLFTPPVASRVQMYPNIAAYEVLCYKDNKLRSLNGQLKDLPKISAPGNNADLSLASMIAFTTVARKLVYSEYMVDQFQQKEIDSWKANNSDTALLSYSIAYGKQSGNEIINWMKGDHYDYTRTLSRYNVADSAGAWQPTSPDYSNAIEPNWHFMRSVIFDSNNMISCRPPLPYSEKKNSAFYISAMNNYKQSIKPDTVQKSIALFWDCNPNITRSAGHFTYFIHKISPGGHWIRITGQAIKNLGIGESRCAQLYTMVSIGQFEAFLCCWNDKYKYNLLRPETYINKLISPKWKPYIETPPFPEYPSGHSVVSGSSAAILSAMIPQPYTFNDSSEMYINLPPRKFKSFKQAADEASVSRFYGGIHFMEALNNGLEQGNKIGVFILGKLKLEQ
jgi:hypothetical protein